MTGRQSFCRESSLIIWGPFPYRFCKENKHDLEQQEVPQIAREYYENDAIYDLSLPSCSGKKARHVLNSLYDVFVAIRDDELEHAKMMNYLQIDLSESKDSND